MRVPCFALACALALLPTVGAQECVPSTSTTNGEMLVWEAPARNEAADYVAIDLCQPGCIFSVWPYYEANGVPGLQRADEMRDDTCGGLIEGDSWIHI